MPGTDEEFYLFVSRCTQFHHIWTIYSDLLSGRYIPSTGDQQSRDIKTSRAFLAEMQPTVMFLLYAFFFSLIEDSEDGLNAFRIWRLKFPDELTAICALEEQVAPLRPDLRVFRNRLGFHGSRSHHHEAPGFDLFANHSGTKMLEVMKVFKRLNAALLSKDLAQKRNSAEELARARMLLDTIPARCDVLAQL